MKGWMALKQITKNKVKCNMVHGKCQTAGNTAPTNLVDLRMVRKEVKNFG
jgi:hypothetical protein